jgi:hypothetical protein
VRDGERGSGRDDHATSARGTIKSSFQNPVSHDVILSEAKNPIALSPAVLMQRSGWILRFAQNDNPVLKRSLSVIVLAVIRRPNSFSARPLGAKDSD